MKVIFGLLILMSSFSASAELSMQCGEIQRMRVWVHGNDTYGVWVEYKTPNQQCPGGYFLPQSGNNHDKVYSFLLSAKTTNSPICIQAHIPAKIGNRCQVNYVMDK